MRLRGKLNPGEHVIIATRQHYGALLPALAYLLVAIAASTFASTARSSPILWTLGMICAVGALLGAVRTAWRWATTYYLLTTHRLVVRRGVMTRTGDESLYLDSMGERWAKQRGPGAWLGYGSVYVVCRGVHHRLTYVPDPKRFEKKLKPPDATTTPYALDIFRASSPPPLTRAGSVGLAQSLNQPPNLPKKCGLEYS